MRVLTVSSNFFLLDVACHHSCKKCTGPQDNKCQDCKPGWILHSNKCIGELQAQDTVCGVRFRVSLKSCLFLGFSPLKLSNTDLKQDMKPL